MQRPPITGGIRRGGAPMPAVAAAVARRGATPMPGTPGFAEFQRQRVVRGSLFDMR